MQGRKKRGSRNLKIMLSAMGITVLALLILALAAKQYRQERRVGRLIRKQM